MSNKKHLQAFINEVIRQLDEKVGASPDYLRKENVRQAIQNVIVSMVAQGEIQSDVDLENFFS